MNAKLIVICLILSGWFVWELGGVYRQRAELRQKVSQCSPYSVVRGPYQEETLDLKEKILYGIYECTTSRVAVPAYEIESLGLFLEQTACRPQESKDDEVEDLITGAAKVRLVFACPTGTVDVAPYEFTR